MLPDGEHAERLECLEKLSRSIAPPAGPAPVSDNWIVSEVDYTPIVKATAVSTGGSKSVRIEIEAARELMQ
jgi:hypothetical protein